MQITPDGRELVCGWVYTDFTETYQSAAAETKMIHSLGFEKKYTAFNVPY